MQYNFVTIWKVSAPRKEVWDAIYNSLEWTKWWRGVLAVSELQKGDQHHLGAIRRYTMRSRMPYKLTFDMESTRVEFPTHLEGKASGALEGTGKWLFTEENGYTIVRYDWNVRTTELWMNLLAPIAKPFFRMNHNTVMRWGAEGLAKKFGVIVDVE